MAVIVSRIVEVFIYRTVNGNPEYLLLKRAESEIHPGIWSVCAGKIEQAEKAFEAGIREMKEETGLTPALFFKTDAVNTFYEDLDDRIYIAPVFLADAGNSVVVLSDEHSEFAWLGFDECMERLHWSSHRSNLELFQKCLTDRKYFATLKQIL